MTGIRALGPDRADEPRVRVVEVLEIATHPGADRLEILTLCRPDPERGIWTVQLVAGPHYQVDALGLYVPPGLYLPGWLAQEMWLCGEGPSANRWHPVREKVMRGVPSPGVFCGQVWRTQRGAPFQPWRMWQARWRPADDVTDWLGAVPAGQLFPYDDAHVAQSAERPADNRGVEGSRPSVGSSILDRR